MNLTLPLEAQKVIESRLRSGRYRTAEDVVTAALEMLARDECGDEFAPGEWDQLLAAGEQSGSPLNGEQVLAELHELRMRHVGKSE